MNFDSLSQDDLGSSNELQERLQKARRLYNAERFDALAGVLDRLVDDFPGDYEAYVLRAKTLWRLERRREALADFERAIRLAPGEASIYYERVQCRRRRDKFDRDENPEELIPDLEKAYQLDPEQPLYLDELLTTYFLAGKFEEVIVYATKIIERNGKATEDNANEFCFRGVAHEMLNHLEEAIDDLTVALRMRPDDASYWAARGRCRITIGYQDEGESDLRRAEELGWTEEEFSEEEDDDPWGLWKDREDWRE